MIDLKELRIGNWIIGTTDGIGMPNQIQQVFSIDENYINPIYNHQGESYYIKPEDAEPIPLTEDILIKCGAGNPEWEMLNIWIDKEGKTIVYYENGVTHVHYCPEYDIAKIPVNTLHQLQNVIHALTGKELEFKP